MIYNTTRDEDMMRPLQVPEAVLWIILGDTTVSKSDRFFRLFFIRLAHSRRFAIRALRIPLCLIFLRNREMIPVIEDILRNRFLRNLKVRRT